jgi:NO-binding membrane sensor protein with MHYT domain
VVAVVRDPPATSELLRIHPFADDKRYMRVPLVDFDYRLVVLSSFIVIIATYATLAVVERMKFAQGTGWFAWLGGGASGIGIGIWSMHYLGLQTLSLPVPTLHSSSVVYSILATIFASGITLLVIGKSDSGRRAKEENQRPMRLEIFIPNRVA